LSGPDLEPYRRAFHAIDPDPAQLLLVATHGDEVVATLELSFIPGLSRRGALRAQTEAVRIDRDNRSQGVGGRHVRVGYRRGPPTGCAHVRLTPDETRADAHNFSERLSFVSSHQGLKLQL
jgi:hypothetical protein